MVTINLTLNNFSELPFLLDLFDSFDNDYEYTTRGVFLRKTPPACLIRTYDEVIQKRLWMINKHWLNLTLFHCPPVHFPQMYTKMPYIFSIRQ